MKKLFLFLLLSVFAIPLAAQENCGLKESPSLLGVRLNMSPEQVQSIFGKSLKIKVKNNDEHGFFQNYIEEKPPPELNGVRALYLRFLDRKLYQIEVFYDEKNEFKTLTDFTDSLALKWNFPASAWQLKEIKSVINCGDFSVAAMKILNPKIEITDETARARIEALREKKGAKK